MTKFLKISIPVVLVPIFIIGTLITLLNNSPRDTTPSNTNSPSAENMQNSDNSILEVPANHQVITLGAGCFWCVETIYQRIDGVTSVTSGYMGGTTDDPSYREICQGHTNHAEVVQVVYNPEIISTEEVLDWFWRLHDPTTLNRQGNDVGTQYRSAIFYHTDEQKIAAKKSKQEANPNFGGNIVTEITAASEFFIAEVEHQDYYRINGNKNPYCRATIPPKLKKLGLEDKEDATK